jgi:RNA polymerase sigma factor (sigma-70 family)
MLGAANQDLSALRRLFERVHRIVYALGLRITGSRGLAEEVTLDVFQDCWSGVSHHDLTKCTVVAWIMNQARAHALERLTPEQEQERVAAFAKSPTGDSAHQDPTAHLQALDRGRVLHTALQRLSPAERHAIEVAYFSRLSYAGSAEQLCQPVGSVITSIRVGLERLGQALHGGGEVHMSCGHTERLAELALSGLTRAEARVVEQHAAHCQECRPELDALRATVSSFGLWPIDAVRPSKALWGRLVDRIAPERMNTIAQNDPEARAEPEWAQVAPGIACQFLSTDDQSNLVSMLVRLEPNTDYPPHTHAALEELHLLDGELWINSRKLQAGGYNRAEPGSSDTRVWSETGCTCVLVTSTLDQLHQASS